MVANSDGVSQIRTMVVTATEAGVHLLMFVKKSPQRTPDRREPRHREPTCRSAQLAHEYRHSNETRAAQSLRAIERIQDPAELQRLGDISRAHKASEDKTPTMCECGCGPFRGQRGMNYHLNNSPFHSDDPMVRDFCQKVTA